MKKNKKQGLVIGLLSGLVLPILTILLIYLIKYNKYSLEEFITLLFLMKIAGNFLQLAGLSNLLLFFVFLQFNKMYSARGVIFATLVLAIIVAILIFV